MNMEYLFIFLKAMWDPNIQLNMQRDQLMIRWIYYLY